MQCPQCGAKNPLGSESCTSCGRPFTRAAASYQGVGASRRHAQPDVHVHYSSVDYTYDNDYGYAHSRQAARLPRERGRLTGCLTALLILIVVSIGIIIALLIATNVFVKPRVANAISEHVGSRIETTVIEQVNVELDGLLAGEITISEADINQRIAQNGNLGPVDDVSLGISPDGVRADLHAYSMNGTFSADVHVQNGQIVLTNGNVSGPLQYVVSEDDVEQIASDAINRSLAESGYWIAGVILQEGALVLTLAR